MADFTIKKGDLLPVLVMSLVDGNGQPIDLTGASGVLAYHLYDQLNQELPAIERPIELLPPLNAGNVQYQWVAGDTDTAGLYCAEVRLSFPTAKPMTFPNKRPFDILIYEECA